MINIKIFNEEEKQFMAHHNLSPFDFYDARGESKAEYYQYAKEQGYGFVIHNHCSWGHRLKDRHGHCIVCHPESIAFQKRAYSGGGLYIAQCGDYCKVGTVDNHTGDLDWTILNRNNSLNGEGGYGGLDDWSIVQSYRVNENVGQLETEIHKQLEEYKVETEYYHSGRIMVAKELFKCPVETVILITENILKAS